MLYCCCCASIIIRYLVCVYTIIIKFIYTYMYTAAVSQIFRLQQQYSSQQYDRAATKHTFLL